MAKHTLKILWCSHRRIFKVCLAILQHLYERVKCCFLETADPFSSDDPFKSDPFKSVSFAEDPFAGDPFAGDQVNDFCFVKRFLI